MNPSAGVVSAGGLLDAAAWQEAESVAALAFDTGREVRWRAGNAGGRSTVFVERRAAPSDGSG